MDLDVLDRFRNVAFLAGGVIAASVLALNLVVSLYSRSRNLRAPSRLSLKRLLLFSTLTLASIAVTSFFAYAYIAQSYHGWLRQAYPPYTDGVAKLPPLARLLHNLGFETLPEKKMKQHPKIGNTAISLELINEWLGAPGRLQEPGEVVSADPARFWWAQQLLYILPGWSLFLGWQGRRYRVSHIWAFMILAQMLSVSFAINLFFVAIILSPIRTPAKISKSAVLVETTGPQVNAKEKQHEVAFRERTNYLDHSHISDSPFVSWSLHLAVIVALATIPFIPAFVGTDLFITVLAFPQLLLLLPTVLPTTSPDNLWSTYKALFLGIITLQALSVAAVLTGLDIKGTASTTIDLAASNLKTIAHFAIELFEAAWDTRLGLSTEDPILHRLVPGYHYSADYVSAQVDHFVLVLNKFSSSTFQYAQQTMLRIVQQIWREPATLLVWIQQASTEMRSALEQIVSAFFSHPVVSGVGADAALCWLSIGAWVVTSSGFDDELAEESIEPALEANETIKGLNGLNGRPGVPVRNSWFESHIG